MAKNEIAKAQTTAVTLGVTFEEDASNGFKDMTQDDFALPFLRLLTNTSPEVGEVDGALPGMILNTVTGELYDGKMGIEVIPCAYVRQYIEWAPRGSGSGAPIQIYPATSDVLSRTHREPGDHKDYLENGNYIENTANHYVMVVDKDGMPAPALVTMKSTQLKKSRGGCRRVSSSKSVCRECGIGRRESETSGRRRDSPKTSVLIYGATCGAGSPAFRERS